MSDITSREWYDEMFARVGMILEQLVALDAAFVGYINTNVEGQPITLSWTPEVVTVTADKYKWQMPIGWFIEAELIAKIVPIQAEASSPVRPQPLARQGANPPRVSDDDEREPSMVDGGVSPIPGVKSVEEIMREQGIPGSDD